MDILSLCPENIEEAADKSAEILKSGGVCICPTDTVYGLLADAFNPRAVKRTYLIKQREPGKPLPVFVKNIDAAGKIAIISDLNKQKLMDTWPGKTTYVLNLKPGLAIPASNGKTIALRIPKHEFLSALLKKVDFPVVGTSANLAGCGPFTEIDKLLAQFENAKEQPDLVVNAGNLRASRPSKIVDLTGSKEKILRK